MKTFQQFKKMLESETNTIDVEHKYKKYESNLKYPDLNKVKLTPNLTPNLFYNSFNFSELSAVLQYTSASFLFDDEELFGIGYIEIQHSKALQIFCGKIGGDCSNVSTSILTPTGNSMEDILLIAIKGEEETISEYERLKAVIQNNVIMNNEQSDDTTEIAYELLDKLIADEKVHLKLLKTKLNGINKF